MSEPGSTAWTREQIQELRRLQPVLQSFAGTLEEVLRAATRRRAPGALVDTRVKSIASFAEKIQRKTAKYTDPVNQLTDLCGARVIVHTVEEKEAICQFIRESFDVDPANSEDEGRRLGTHRFGYRSTHFIVQVRDGLFPTDEVPVASPPEVIPGTHRFSRNPLKAEIQVRTLLEHAWASFTHDRAYKAPFDLSPGMERELNTVSAQLEAADGSFARILSDLELLGSNPAVLGAERRNRELEVLQAVFEAEAPEGRAGVVLRLARLHRSARAWGEVIELVESYLDSTEHREIEDEHAELEMELGYALCQQNRNDPKGQRYLDGQDHLRRAAGLEKSLDPLPRLEPGRRGRLRAQASAWLGWSFSSVPAKRLLVRSLLSRALQGDPDNPLLLVDFLSFDLSNRSDWSLLAVMRPALERAIEVCRSQIEVRINVPGIYFTKGLLHLFLAEERDLGDGQPRRATAVGRNHLYEGLYALARGVQGAESIDDVDSALERVQILQDVVGVHGTAAWVPRMLSWASTLLLCGKVARTPAWLSAAEKELEKVSQKLDELEARAGQDTDESVLEKARRACETAREEVARLEAASRDSRRALEAYSSENLTQDDVPEPVLFVCGGTAPDIEQSMRRYREVFLTALRSVQGAVISGGTGVGIPGAVGDASLELGSGRNFELCAYLPNCELPWGLKHEAYKILARTEDHDFSPAQAIQSWVDLIWLEYDPSDVIVIGINGGPLAELEYRLGLAMGAKVGLLEHTGRAVDDVLADPDLVGFPNLMTAPDLGSLQCLLTSPEPIAQREILGRRLHEEYRRDQLSRASNLRGWDEGLTEDLKESNRQQADDIGRKLAAIQCGIREESGASDSVHAFTVDEVERMARLEHDRWNAEKLRDGWRYGPKKDVPEKRTPYLVSWEELPDEVKEWDRVFIRSYPELLGRIGLEVYRLS